MVSPVKRSEHAAKHAKHNQVHVVTNHRLAADHASHVFPEHIGENHWHKGPRQGHPGSGRVKAKLVK